MFLLLGLGAAKLVLALAPLTGSFLLLLLFLFSSATTWLTPEHLTKRRRRPFTPRKPTQGVPQRKDDTQFRRR